MDLIDNCYVEFGKRKYTLMELLKAFQCAIDRINQLSTEQKMQNLDKYWMGKDGSPICKKIKVGENEAA